MIDIVIQDPHIMVEAIYNMGINLVNERKSIEDIPYNFDETGVAVLLQYSKYISNIAVAFFVTRHFTKVCRTKTSWKFANNKYYFAI